MLAQAVLLFGTSPTPVAAAGTPSPGPTQGTSAGGNDGAGQLDQAGHPVAQILALLVVLVVLVALTAFTTGGLRGLFLGKDKRLSTSKTTALLWTVFVSFVFLTEVFAVLHLGGASLTSLQEALKPLPSSTYLLLLGGPFAALVAAKGIVVSRLANGTLQKVTTGNDAGINITDLVTDDTGQTDLIDLQFFLFNLIALVFATGLFVHHPLQGLPAIPNGLAALTSVAALAYVGNKAVSQSVPMLQSLIPGVARPGQAIELNGVNLVPPHNADDNVLSASPTITVGGLLAEVLRVPAPNAKTLSFRVPDGASAGANEVLVTIVGDSTATAKGTVVVEMDSVVLSSVAPNPASGGAELFLSGRHFLDSRETGGELPTVSIGGVQVQVPAAPEATDNRLVVTLPASAQVGDAAVVVRRGSLQSTGYLLTIA